MKRLFIFYVLLLLVLPGTTAFAMQAKQYKKIGNWHVYIFGVKGKNKCYAYTMPYRTRIYEADREQPYLMLYYGSPAQYMISSSSGFEIDRTKGCILEANGNSYRLNVEAEEIAWTYTASQDISIINQLIKGDPFLQIRAYSKADAEVLDYYSTSELKKVDAYFGKHCQ